MQNFRFTTIIYIRRKDYWEQNIPLPRALCETTLKIMKVSDVIMALSWSFMFHASHT